jgi:putative restriction endonuclease
MSDDLDLRVRMAAFQFLDEHVRSIGEVLPLTVLRRGFSFDGVRVPVMNAVQGIFKPGVLREMPLSITTTPVADDAARPYDDLMTTDGLLYRYRGKDPKHPDNVGLRLAMQRQRPVIYFHGIVPGQYFPEWPVYVVGDAPERLTFTVSIDDRRLAGMQPREDDQDAPGRRRYVTREVQYRLHQQAFRLRVVEAYRRHCAVCKLRHQELLEAAHILPDGHPRGEPIVPNGVALCSLHHRAFDAHILGVTPDFVIEVRPDVLVEVDGPMLIHGIQGFHGSRIQLPTSRNAWPRREFLEERYSLFRKIS